MYVTRNIPEFAPPLRENSWTLHKSGLYKDGKMEANIERKTDDVCHIQDTTDLLWAQRPKTEKFAWPWLQVKNEANLVIRHMESTPVETFGNYFGVYNLNLKWNVNNTKKLFFFGFYLIEIRTRCLWTWVALTPHGTPGIWYFYCFCFALFCFFVGAQNEIMKQKLQQQKKI